MIGQNKSRKYFNSGLAYIVYTVYLYFQLVTKTKQSHENNKRNQQDKKGTWF